MPNYQRIVLKLSGEVLAGGSSFGIDPERVKSLAEEIAEVARTTGPGSVEGRGIILGDLFSRATGPEAEFMVRLLGGELRQGALEGLLTEAVAAAAGLKAAVVRRALMLQGAGSAFAPRLDNRRPLSPMLTACRPPSRPCSTCSISSSSRSICFVAARRRTASSRT